MPRFTLRLLNLRLPHHTKPRSLLVAAMRHHVETHTVNLLKPQLPIKPRACLCGNQERLRMSRVRVLEADIHQLFPEGLAAIFREGREEIYNYETRLGVVCGNA